MISNESEARVRLVGCVTPTAAEADLERHFADRAAQLAHRCARELHHAAVEGEAQFTGLLSALGHEVEPLQGELLRHAFARQAGKALVPLLIEQYALFERWLVVRHGALYPILLFGRRRAVPFWKERESCVPVREVVGSIADEFDVPCQGLLVEVDGRLQIAKAEAVSDRDRLRSLLLQFEHGYLRVYLFSV